VSLLISLIVTSVREDCRTRWNESTSTWPSGESTIYCTWPTYLAAVTTDKWHPYYYQLLTVCNNPDSCEINYVLFQKFDVCLPIHPYNPHVNVLLSSPFLLSLHILPVSANYRWRCQHCTKDICNKRSPSRYKSLFTTWNGRPHSPRGDMTVVSCQQRWGEGGRTTPYTYTWQLLNSTARLPNRNFKVTEIALLMHCTSGAGIWEWKLRFWRG